MRQKSLNFLESTPHVRLAKSSACFRPEKKSRKRYCLQRGTLEKTFSIPVGYESLMKGQEKTKTPAGRKALQGFLFCWYTRQDSNLRPPAPERLYGLFHVVAVSCIKGRRGLQKGVCSEIAISAARHPVRH